MSVDPRDEKSVFEAALALPTPAEREAYLNEVCGPNTAARARIAALVRARQDQDHFLNQFLPASESLSGEPVETCGTVIGRYKLLEKIGEGGMAVVYMAEQTEPIRRKVALKIIKLGMDTRQVIARFEAERQALALMDHPSIAKVLDAGSTETGRPYFVMELVQGVSITEYCDRNSLSTKERLALFLQVCHAVQHAHQKGIIHRDIKPSNVMVTHRDGQPLPKVIDFGIAKATNQKLTEKTLFTRYAHLIGTPAYMSPEQAELSDLDIDTRSDIYSLGVLLYELLTGTTPFSEEELRKAGSIEMQRVIREQEPVKPSTKLSTLGKTLTDLAERRNSTPDVLQKGVRGDLDWIVMKTLEKDRARRYETASGLAEDIRRHLAHEPVVARGPSTTYRLRKFLRRHRAPTIAALAVVLLAGAAVGVLSLWNRDRLQLAEAQGFRDRGILSQAREQYASGERDAALGTIQPILDSPQVGGKAQLLRAGILVDTYYASRKYGLMSEDASVMEALRAHDPLAHSLHATALRELGRCPEAVAEYDRALALTPREHPQYLDTAIQRCETLLRIGRYEHVVTMAQEMLKLWPDKPVFQYQLFCAQTALGEYGKADAVFHAIVQRTPTARNEFRLWATKYVFDTLEAGRL
jgi:serine/threonine protein kinase